VEVHSVAAGDELGRRWVAKADPAAGAAKNRVGGRRGAKGTELAAAQEGARRRKKCWRR
jgi:hypothetical protein